MTRCARCDWQPDVGFGPAAAQLVEHARSSSHPLCIVCARSLRETDPTLSCESCLTAAREDLSGIVTMWAELPRHLGVLGAQVYDRGRGGGDEHQLPGGTVLALLAPGSAGGAARRLTRTDVERGVDGREHRVDNQADDTPSVAWSLASWEDDWRHTRGEPAAVGTGTAAVMRGASRYLEVHARWAANQHAAFDEFASDLRSLHLRLEVATQRRRQAVKANADCFRCGGDLVRQVDEGTGLEEAAWTCVVCSLSYDDGQYLLALRAAAEAAARIVVNGETWATPAAMASDLQRSERTIRSWHQRELVRSHLRGGVLFVHVADVEARHADGQASRGRTA